MKYKKGDKVKVYSLQSFSQGGFLNGDIGKVYQDQNEGGSVLVAVKRNFDGKIKMDKHYEVYPEQLRLVERIKKEKPIKDRFEILDL